MSAAQKTGTVYRALKQRQALRGVTVAKAFALIHAVGNSKEFYVAGTDPTPRQHTCAALLHRGSGCLAKW